MAASMIGFVSIHASVKDATQKYNPPVLWLTVSIHASVKDATLVLLKKCLAFFVSIHASVKDATYFYFLRSFDNLFQSTHL